MLGTTPFHMALDSSGAGITHWKHEPLHDVVEPMTHHVIMAYNSSMQRMERRVRKIGCDWNVSPRCCDHHSRRIKLPMGYSKTCRCRSALSSAQNTRARCPRSRHRRSWRPAGANGASRPHHIAVAHFDSAADVLEGNAALDALFRQQVTDLLATRLLAAHTGTPTTFQQTMGGLAPKTLLRAIERLRSDSDTDVSLPPWPRMPACRAFTSAALSRKAPGFRHMPGCANTGSSRP